MYTIYRKYLYNMSLSTAEGESPNITDTVEAKPIAGMKASLLVETGVIPRSADSISETALLPWTRVGAESFLRADTISYRLDGQEHQTDLAQQAIISTTGSGAAARSRYERLTFLRDSGVPTPTLYGLDGADLLTEYIRGCRSPKDGLRFINSETTPDRERDALLAQLVGIAAILDAKGFSPSTPYVDDLLFNGESFYVNDTGFDLGGPNLSKPTHTSLNALKKACSLSLHPAIEAQYEIAREQQ